MGLEWEGEGRGYWRSPLFPLFFLAISAEVLAEPGADREVECVGRLGGGGSGLLQVFVS